jgi:hypothetical protein
LSIKLLLDVEVWKCILDVFFVPSWYPNFLLKNHS